MYTITSQVAHMAVTDSVLGLFLIVWLSLSEQIILHHLFHFKHWKMFYFWKFLARFILIFSFG
jgi:hypothetical protein